jgi:hypothetical protein
MAQLRFMGKGGGVACWVGYEGSSKTDCWLTWHRWCRLVASLIRRKSPRSSRSSHLMNPASSTARRSPPTAVKLRSDPPTSFIAGRRQAKPCCHEPTGRSGIFGTSEPAVSSEARAAAQRQESLKCQTQPRSDMRCSATTFPSCRSTALIDSVFDYARNNMPDYLFTRVTRTWIYSTRVAEKNSIKYEAVAVSTLMRDIGLTSNGKGSNRFEVNGADRYR